MDTESQRRLWLNSLPKDGYPVTRLVCARMYLFGLPLSLAVVNRLLGMPYSAVAPSIGYDHDMVLFHAIQSALLSLAVLALAVIVYYFPFGAPNDLLPWIAILVVGKIAIVNPAISRFRFGPARKDLDFRIPGIHGLADRISNALRRKEDREDFNTVYFKGPRPFVGFGSEITAWTVVIDTTARDHSIATLVGQGPGKGPAEIAVDALYNAIQAKIGQLHLSDIDSSWANFVDGELTEDSSRLRKSDYRRPPAGLSEQEIDALDSQGNKGRCYFLLQSNNREQDLCVSQFVRFRQSGDLIFGEFASYVLPPAKRRFYFADRLFRIHPLLYLLWGLVILFLAGVFSVLLSPFVENLLWLELPWGFVDFSLIDEYYLEQQLLTGWVLFRIVASTFFIFLAFVLWRVFLKLYAFLGIFFGLRLQYGIPKSYREHVAKGTALDYFDLQSVI